MATEHPEILAAREHLEKCRDRQNEAYHFFTRLARGKPVPPALSRTTGEAEEALYVAMKIWSTPHDRP